MKYFEQQKNTPILNLCDSSFFIQPTTKDEVEIYIKTLNSHKTKGLSSLPNKLFKQFKKRLKIQLAKLANITFELGEFPEILKTAVKLYRSTKKAVKLTAITITQFL